MGVPRAFGRHCTITARYCLKTVLGSHVYVFIICISQYVKNLSGQCQCFLNNGFCKAKGLGAMLDESRMTPGNTYPCKIVIDKYIKYNE